MTNTDDKVYEIYKTIGNTELIVQQFEELVYELLEKDQWPTHKEIIEYFNLPNIRDLHKSPVTKRMSNELISIMKRRVMCEIFSFSIPSFEALQTIIEFQPILEIGAGSGFWAALLKKNNCGIIATTIDDENHPFSKKFTEIEYLKAIDAVKKYPDRTVLCNWPSADTWAEEVLPHIKRLIISGEPCSTATDIFHDTLAEEFKEIKRCSLPQWLMINDRLTVYERE